MMSVVVNAKHLLCVNPISSFSFLLYNTLSTCTYYWLVLMSAGVL